MVMTGAGWGPLGRAGGDGGAMVQAVIAAIAMTFTTLAGIYIPKVLAAFERQTRIALTDQESAAIQRAIVTAAGLVQNKLDTGVLRARDITPSNPIVVAET